MVCVCLCVCGSHARGAFACQSSNHPPIPPSPSPPPPTPTTQPRMPSSTHICSLRISARHRPSCLYFLPFGCLCGVRAWAGRVCDVSVEAKLLLARAGGDRSRCSICHLAHGLRGVGEAVHGLISCVWCCCQECFLRGCPCVCVRVCVRSV
jgi:hypothetical protein